MSDLAEIVEELPRLRAEAERGNYSAVGRFFDEVRLDTLRDAVKALETLYVESGRPYAVYGNPAVSTIEELVRFENARIEVARVIGLERLNALLAEPAAKEGERG